MTEHQKKCGEYWLAWEHAKGHPIIHDSFADYFYSLKEEDISWMSFDWGSSYSLAMKSFGEDFIKKILNKYNSYVEQKRRIKKSA